MRPTDRPALKVPAEIGWVWMSRDCVPRLACALRAQERRVRKTSKGAVCVVKLTD